MVFKWLRKFYYRFLIGVARRLNLCLTYESRKGIKTLNNLYGNPELLSNNYFFLQSDQLFLEKDFLKDKFTLVDVNIRNSPHFELMKIIKDGGSIKESSYVKRFEEGALDARCPSFVSKKDIQKMHDLYKQRCEEILSGEYEAVKVYRLHDKYYIYDGKHRAALCSLLGQRIKCQEIRYVGIADGLIYRKYQLMKDKKEYSKTVHFLEDND